MRRTNQQLRADALAIWHAGVQAVRSDQLVAANLSVVGDALHIADEEIPLAEIERILVVGAGKAGAGMAAGLERALGPQLLREKCVAGWVNVPEDCVQTLSHIRLHPARPAGKNEPTAAGVAGTQEILRLVEAAGPRDLCFCLLSGGGSALLPAPVAGVSLADKQAVTRHLSGAGANIQQLNTVRKQLSRIKGGGLTRSCRAGRLVTLIISDVLGDPLDVIASGPTVPDTATPAEALEILAQFGAREAGIPASVFAAIEARMMATSGDGDSFGAPTPAVVNLVIGNNAVAVDAAGQEAERRGYSHAMHATTELEGQAEEVGRHLANMALRMRNEPGPDCLITGGEPVVELVDAARRGDGGRNQQLVLAALVELLENADDAGRVLDGIALLSGGTDGEDGPTDAAGAAINAALAEKLVATDLEPREFLQRNDAYHFFAPLEALIHTGPTHTNVCDIRVVVVSQDC